MNENATHNWPRAFHLQTSKRTNEHLCVASGNNAMDVALK